MTLIEACKRFGLDEKKLAYYEENGLLCGAEHEGITDYDEHEIQNVSLIQFLFAAGLTVEEVKIYMRLEKDHEDADRRVAILRKYRCRLLDETHEKQKMIDRIDYTVHEIKKGNNRRNQS
ncbi:MAG: MerR family transcriptional regulator [Ruminococcus flavefaciens]|nr:MerR family transcriptional regulator [Ruminococcus flavefaciens]